MKPRRDFRLLAEPKTPHRNHSRHRLADEASQERYILHAICTSNGVFLNTAHTATDVGCHGWLHWLPATEADLIGIT